MPQRHAPATARNRDAILKVLKTTLPETGCVLEIASGSGEHAVYFAPQLTPRQWLPSDIDPVNLASIQAWSQAQPSAQLLKPVALDACDSVWPVEQSPPTGSISAIVNINMIHIAPWEACIGLFKGAARLLPTKGIVFLYGPFAIGGQHTAPSNAQFDEHLRARNTQWGIRSIEAVTSLANSLGFERSHIVQMPANNLSVVFSRL